MAESYRGLTIRIGGDTTKLTQALRTANQAATGAQQEIKKLGDVLKLDPSNIEAYNLQMGYMGDKATATAMRLHQLKEAAEQIGGEGIQLASGNLSEPVEELAAATENASMRAAQAKAAYNKVNDSLADMFRTLTQYNDAVAKEFSSTLKADIKIDSSNEVLDDFGKKLAEAFDQFDGVFAKPKRSIESVIEEMKKLRTQFLETESDAKKIKLEEKFEKLREELTQINGQKISFSEGNTDWGSIDNVLEKLSAIGFDPSQISRFSAELFRLKTEYQGAMDELQKANAVAQFRDLQVEILKAEASVKSIAKALSDMKAPSELMRGLTELTEKADLFKNSYTTMTGNARSLEVAFGINPENIEAQEAAMKEWAAAEQTAADRAEVLRNQISQFDRAEIDQYADATKTAQRQLVEAAVAHENAAQKVHNYKGAIEATRMTLAQLGLDASEVAKILSEDIYFNGMDLEEAELFDASRIAEQIDLIQKLIDTLSELDSAESSSGKGELSTERRKQLDQLQELKAAVGNLVKAEEEESNAAKTLEYSKQRRDLESLDTQIVQATGDMDAARVAQQKLAAGDIKLLVDTTGIEKLKEVQKDLSDFGSSVGKQFSDAANDISVLGSITDGLAERAKTLMSVFEADPSNMAALELGIRAFDESLAGCNIRAEQLEQIIAQYTPDKIDEVALSTDAVGLNAERAARKVSEAFKQIEDAKKQVDELSKQYSDALSSAEGNEGGANNQKVQELREQLEAATAKLRELESVGQQALNSLDTANATKELVEYREELAKVGAKAVEVAEARADALKSQAVKIEFESSDEIDELGKQLDIAVERAKAFDNALQVKPGNIQLLNEKQRAYNEVARISKERAEAIQRAIDGYDTSKINKLRDSYGSVNDAVKNTTTAFKTYQMVLTAAESEFDKLLDDAGLSGMRDAILNTADAVHMNLTPDIVEARNEVIVLKNAINGAAEEMGNAVTAQYVESLPSMLAETIGKTNIDATPKVDEAAFQQVMGRIVQYAKQAASEIVESANTIDAAYRDMRKTVEGTEYQFEQLRNEAISFSQTHITSADTILKMESLGGQLGIVVENLQEFGEVASNVVIATDIGAEDAALELGQLTNIMSDLDQTTFQNVADALVRLGNTTATTESRIMNVAQRMAAIANVTSMTTPELLAWSAAIASTGQRSESAATAINNTITGIGSAVAEGGDTLEQFAKIANMTSEEFEEAWENNSSAALEAFVKGLGTLTDDSTAAIEALDSVGISSVRQETALLALSQTIENLDGAMTNAKTAFNGGGDAAREAEQKSQGFSGALGIMQSNASNLAASMGDGLLPVIQAISTVLATLTDLLNSLDGPIKNAVVVVGGATVSLALLGSTLDELKKKWEKMAADIATSPEKFGALRTSIIEAGTAISELLGGLRMMPAQFAAAYSSTGSLTAGFHAMGAGARVAAAGVLELMSALVVPLVITALIAAIGEVVNAYSEWKEHEDLVASANKGLADTLGESEQAYKDYAEGIKAASRSAEEISSANEKFLQSQAEFANSVGSTMETIASNAATIDHYAETMKELSGSCDGSAWSLQKLQEAVNGYNDLTGSSISIINDTTGQLNILDEALDDVTEAFKEQAKVDAYAELYKQAVEKQIEAEVELGKSKDELAENQRRLAEETDMEWNERLKLTNANNELTKSLQEQQQVYQERTKDVEYLDREIEKQADATTDASHAIKDYSSALAAAGMSTDDFSELTKDEKEKINEVNAALVEAGTSLLDYGNLNKDQLSSIAAAWRNNTHDILSMLDKMKKATEDVNTKPSDEQYQARKLQYDADYTAAKRAADDYYSSQKTARDNEYNAEKRRLDNEYNNRKKAFDKAYSARKDALDKEYSAAKSASDKYLKQFKAAQDEAVKVFKAATDKRVAALKDEYEQKKKLIEKETKEDTDPIDERIAELKAETQAEKDAAEAKARNEKVAELQLAVQRAKTNKKRAEAQKELNDYIAEIDEKDRQRRREDLIDALEEQKDAIEDAADDRQDVLKDSYDKAVQEYKDGREKLLSAMQASQSEEYEREKEKEAAKLQLRKDANDQALQNMKESQEVELAVMKQANDDALSSIKARHEQELLQIKRQNEDSLTALKNRQDSELKQYKEFGDAVAEAAEESAERVNAATNKLSQAEAENTRTLKDILDDMLANHQISLSTYLNAINQVPGAMRTVFTESGLAASEGLGSIAQQMYEGGEITYEQYQQALWKIPGATDAVFTENALIAADKLGLISQSAEQASSDAATNISSHSDEMEKNAEAFAKIPQDKFSMLPEKLKSKSDEAGQAATSLGGQKAVNDAAANSKTVADSIESPFKVLPSNLKTLTGNAMVEAANGMAKDSDKPGKNMGEIYKGLTLMAEQMQDNNNVHGYNMVMQLANGMTSASPAVRRASEAIAQVVYSYLHHSTPDVGPLHGDDKWGGESVESYADSMLGKSGYLQSAAQKTAGVIADGFNVDGLTFDPTQDLLARMRSQENALARQAQKMSDILESNFDPRLTVDAAYEAMDRISAGKLRMQRATMSPQQVSNVTNAPVINVNCDFSGTTVRDDSDIDRLSAEFERRMRRIIASQIG